MLKIEFSYIDEFGQESKLSKTITEDNLEVITPFDLLLEQFKCFLIGAGFDQEQVSAINKQ